MKENLILNKKNIGVVIKKAKREIRKVLLKEHLTCYYKISKKIKCIKALRFYLSRLAEEKGTVFWVMLYENLTAFVGLMVLRGRKVLDNEDC
jgi:hypothetical protein